MRFLVLTASFGDGHNTAAINVSRALTELANGRAECPVYDAIVEANPLAARALQSGYQLAITSLPRIWSFLYKKTESVNLTEPPLEVFNGVLDWVEAKMMSFQPNAIISSYPLYPSLIRRIDRSIPIYTVITDSITVHRSWATTPSSLHFVTDDRSAAVAESIGLPRASVQVSGFPVATEFARHSVVARSSLKRLLWICSTNTRHSVVTLRSLLKELPTEVSLTIVLGRHSARLAAPFERELTQADGRHSVKVLGWRDDLPQLMFDHDLIITKAGGATTHECSAAGIPMAINYVVPGQEEGNAELAIHRGSAISIARAIDTGPMIRTLITENKFSQLAQNAVAHSISDGAFRIARKIIEAHSPSEL